MTLQKVSWPQDSRRLADWLTENGRTALQKGREDKTWKEWWVVQTLSESAAPPHFWPASFKIEHTGENPDVADFTIELNDGTTWSVEVTEATTPEDRRAIAESRHLPGVHGVGDPIKRDDGKIIDGGRFRGGVEGVEYSTAMVEDILHAIARKSEKKYAKGAWLLIYPNSNAMFAKMDVVGSYLKRLGPDKLFERVVVCRDSGAAILIDHERVEVYRPEG